MPESDWVTASYIISNGTNRRVYAKSATHAALLDGSGVLAVSELSSELVERSKTLLVSFGRNMMSHRVAAST